MLDVWADFLTVVATFAGLWAGGFVPLWPLMPIILSFALFLAALCVIGMAGLIVYLTRRLVFGD